MEVGEIQQKNYSFILCIWQHTVHEPCCTHAHTICAAVIRVKDSIHILQNCPQAPGPTSQGGHSLTSANLQTARAIPNDLLNISTGSSQADENNCRTKLPALHCSRNKTKQSCSIYKPGMTPDSHTSTSECADEDSF